VTGLVMVNYSFFRTRESYFSLNTLLLNVNGVEFK